MSIGGLHANHTRSASELVAELEFVWNQIKDNNSPSSSGSYRKETLYGMPPSPRQDQYYDTHDYLDQGHGHARDHQHGRQHRRPSLGAPASDGGPMKMLSPMSEEDEAERENRMRMIEEELNAAASADDNGDAENDDTGGDAADDDGGDEGETRIDDARRRRRRATAGTRSGGLRGVAATPQPEPEPAKRENQRWHKMMERAMVKVSAEVAALREQITAGREFRSRRESRPFEWAGWLAWALFKHVALDLLVLTLVLLWMRRRKDRRLEDHVRGALRVLREYIRKVLPSR